MRLALVTAKIDASAKETRKTKIWARSARRDPKRVRAEHSGGKENLPGLLRRQRPKFQERQAKILAQIKRSKNTAETSSRIEEQISTQKSLAA
jgi:hypothetical protein